MMYRSKRAGKESLRAASASMKTQSSPNDTKTWALSFPRALRIQAAIARESLAFRTSFVICPLTKRIRSEPVNRNLMRSDKSKNDPCRGLRGSIPLLGCEARYSPDGGGG